MASKRVCAVVGVLFVSGCCSGVSFCGGDTRASYGPWSDNTLASNDLEACAPPPNGRAEPDQPQGTGIDR